jgi:hypothetical protein
MSSANTRWLLLAAAAVSMQAAVIRGVVVDHQSGRPLARALVALQPLSGAGDHLTVRTNQYGVFEFPPLAGGAYVVAAVRRSFARVEYGQKNIKAAGLPIVIEESASTFLNIRLPKFGAITGTVLDENDVGLPEHEVAAYLNTRPPRLVTRVKADDRGVYRLAGLAPGTYLVRTVGKLYDEDSYLPTYSPESTALDQGRTVEVVLDQDTANVNVRPKPGQLFTLAGSIVPPQQVNLTLVSDTGRQTTTAAGTFEFRGLPPGPYQLFADMPQERLGAYTMLSLDRDRTEVNLGLHRYGEVDVSFLDGKGGAVDPSRMQVMARRVDLAGEGEPVRVRSVRRAPVPMPPGPWEFTVTPMPDFAVVGFSAIPRERVVEKARPDAWNPVTLASGGAYIRFSLTAAPAAFHGAVKSGSDTVAGAPVFLETLDPDTGRRLADLRVTRTDGHGQYRFTGLAPGAYRILSTFEFQAPEVTDLDAAAKLIRASGSQDDLQDLELYIIR